MSSDPTVFYLTEKESIKVQRWADEHSIQLSSGTLEIAYAFCPLGSTVEFVFRDRDGRQKTLMARDYFDPDDPCELSSVNIGSQRICLDFPTEVIGGFLRNASEDINAHFEADCEPPGSEAIIRFDHGKRELVYN